MLSACLFFFFKQKTAYEMRISDWSSDVCSSDLPRCVRSLFGQARRRRGSEVPEPVIVDVRGVNTVNKGAQLMLQAICARLGDQFELSVPPRSEERRVGTECVSTCRSRGSP